MGYISLRRTAQAKALDWRIEQKRTEANVRSKHRRLREMMDQANSSRREILNAMGLFRSSKMDEWNADIEADRKAWEQLNTELVKGSPDYERLSPKELESKLIACHETELKIKALIDKYSAAMAQDAENVRQYREDRRRDLERRVNK
jgi:hypothetical protein